MGSKIGIRVFIKDCTYELVEIVSEKLKSSVLSVQRKISMKLVEKEVYWKFKDLTECIFVITLENNFVVKDFMTLFDVDWHYNEVKVRVEEAPIDQNAIWSANVSDKVLMHKSVEWVHVYNLD
jgi:hypothetical protein